MNTGIAAALAGRRRGGSSPYDLWVSRVDAAGGTYETDSKTIASALVTQLQGFTGYTKVMWLAPLLGANLAAARVPLIDVLGVGIMGNTGFVNGDFSQAAGLQGGTNKYLDTLIKPASLNSGLVGGIGYWENNPSAIAGGSDSVAFGCYNAASSIIRWQLDIRPATQRVGWGISTNAAIFTGAIASAEYYGQSLAANDRKLYKNGSQVASNTTSEASAHETVTSITLMGTSAPNAGWFGGRCAVAYLTDGTLSPTEISDLHTLLGTYLITPTGR
jgi:hypothetical protein